MDSSQILQMVADFGALGLASGAIFWLYLKMSQRLDLLTDNFQKQLREQMEDCNRLESIEKELQDTEGLIKEGLGEMRNHYAKISAVIGKEV